jgi:hypothetical protein
LNKIKTPIIINNRLWRLRKLSSIKRRVSSKIISCGRPLGLKRLQHSRRTINYIKRCNIKYRCDKILNMDSDKTNRMKILDELTALSQELGLYD